MFLRKHRDGGAISIDPFDFVVVGAGSAGAVLAARLSDNPRGRGVGGSSSVNAMGAIRGMPDDYDRWVDEFGCAGWG